VATDLVNGERLTEKTLQGRGMLSAFVGNGGTNDRKNGELALRQYKAVQKDGSVTGSIGVDNFNHAIDNAFGENGRHKSAGQIFTEVLSSTLYSPYGLIEDAADALGGSVLGIGKVSDDRSYVDDLLDKTINVVSGAGKFNFLFLRLV